MRLISGTGNLPLAQAIAGHLDMTLTEAAIRRFADGEIFVEILENVRGKDVFVLQPTSCPANDNLMELLILMDALRRGSARRITAVLPYFGYARQDRKTSPRTPISAKLVANLITAAGASRVLTVDLHAAQIQGFFDIPVDNLYALPVFDRHIRDRYPGLEGVTVVSPDIGGVARARALAKRLDNADLAIIDKRRDGPGRNEVMHVIGTVRDRHCLMVDDMVDSGGTLVKAAAALRESGACSVSAYASHGVFSPPASRNIESSVIENLVVTDSIKASPEIAACSKIERLSLAPLLAEAVRSIHDEQSLSALFDSFPHGAL
ncbi:MAG: ribose-phosphate pyrophosphokinase [Alphaproteobacteria bacterium]|nr:MAG: ribose-phosphate pyrophosphokinase [Alphaproteobacteria bacterium]